MQRLGERKGALRLPPFGERQQSRAAEGYPRNDTDRVRQFRAIPSAYRAFLECGLAFSSCRRAASCGAAARSDAFKPSSRHRQRGESSSVYVCVCVEKEEGRRRESLYISRTSCVAAVRLCHRTGDSILPSH